MATMHDQTRLTLSVKTALLTTFTILVAASTSTAQIPPTATTIDEPGSDVVGEPPVPAQKVEIAPNAADSEIQDRINKILLASEWFENLNVRVDEGIVFLDGVALEANNQEWAGIMSRNVEDVVAVVNNISLQDTSSFDLSKSSTHITASLWSLWRDFLSRLPLIIVGFIILVLTWCVDNVAAVVVRRSAKQARLRSSLQDLLVQLSTFVTWILGLMIAAVVVFPGMTPAKLLTVLGLGSVALGFAFKDIFENFFAGILILWRFPLDKGDFIECNGIEGRVEDVTIRMAQIRQVDGQLVVVPNSVLFKNPVNVLTNTDLRRTSIVCGVAYREDADHCRDIIRNAVQDCPTVAASKPIEIFANEFAASSINFEVTWWTGSTPLDIRRSVDEVVASVKRSLDTAGIEIPFPQRTLTFQQPLSLNGCLQHERSTPKPDSVGATANEQSDMPSE